VGSVRCVTVCLQWFFVVPGTVGKAWADVKYTEGVTSI